LEPFRQESDTAWSAGPVEFPAEDSEDADGTGWMLDVLVEGTPEAYQRFAGDYYEVVPDVEAIRHIYAHKPLTQEIVSLLNPAVSLTDLDQDTARIGYPAARIQEAVASPQEASPS
jgi:hypothetical protein